MNLLEHNFPEEQPTPLRNRRIHFQKIGRDIGRLSIKQKLQSRVHAFRQTESVKKVPKVSKVPKVPKVK